VKTEGAQAIDVVVELDRRRRSVQREVRDG
jgi:hypothetical protein